MTLEELITKYLGHPFKEGEFDCYVLVMKWFEDLGHHVPDYHHNRYWGGEKIDLREYFKFWRRLGEGEVPRTHDGIFMENAFGSKYHMGIVTNNGLFIHCNKHGVTQDRVEKYRRLIKGIYRLRAMDG